MNNIVFDSTQYEQRCSSTVEQTVHGFNSFKTCNWVPLADYPTLAQTHPTLYLIFMILFGTLTVGIGGWVLYLCYVQMRNLKELSDYYKKRYNC